MCAINTKSNCVYVKQAFMLLLVLLLCSCITLIIYADDAGTTIWTTGSALMPAWGLYPNGGEYGGTAPLGGSAAWNAGSNVGIMTWLVDIPAEGAYSIWVRRYGGYGSVKVSLNEKPVTGGRGKPAGSSYVWEHLGEISIPSGKHFIDITVEHCMFDAVLLTLDKGLQPETAKLPEPVREPFIRGFRTYKDDSYLKKVAGKKGFVAASAVPYAEVSYDYVPSDKQVINKLKMWGSPNQYAAATFAVRTVDNHMKDFSVTMSNLIGAVKSRPIKEIDMRIVSVLNKKSSLYERYSAQRLPIADMLLKNDQTGIPPKGRQGSFGGAFCLTSIPAHQTRQFWITVHIPAGYPAGIYKGKVQLKSAGSRIHCMTLPVELEVLPIDLQASEGYNSIYYIGRPGTYIGLGRKVSIDRYKTELLDQVQHGLNTTTLYGGAPTLKYVKEAGMTEPPCIMFWPQIDTPKGVAEAKALGFDDVLYYGVDEPGNPEAIERCKTEAVNRLKAGLHTLTAINNETAQDALKDVISYPVYILYRFDGKDNPAVMYARGKGFHPIAYSMTGISYPLHNRAVSGLYSKACGYEGSSPWAYYESTENDTYGAECLVNNMTYPDEYGRPIPTLRWEAHRDGIDDARYLEALDRAITIANTQLQNHNPPVGLDKVLENAKRVRAEKYESITGRWFQYLCSLNPGDLETIRREMADAIVGINKCLQ